ncbi:MAG: hypothetical protein D6698_08940 [Gammaproteobacteria bacterium]|nr:MAG: hypothetical protein D6698_08940 [Gammaproteobacteria bacterium]
MSSRQQPSTRQKLEKIHENIVVALGVVIGVVLVGYFFSYAMLTDRGRSEALWFEAVSAVLFVFILFHIKRVAAWLMMPFLSKGSREILRHLYISK